MGRRLAIKMETRNKEKDLEKGSTNPENTSKVSGVTTEPLA